MLSDISEHKKLGYEGTKFRNHAVIIGWSSGGHSVVETADRRKQALCSYYRQSE